jgi:hypothetical protein
MQRLIRNKLSVLSVGISAALLAACAIDETPDSLDESTAAATDGFAVQVLTFTGLFRYPRTVRDRPRISPQR